MIISGKLFIPDQTKAVLWDMDGVLVDSLGFDAIVVNKLLKKYFGEKVTLSRQYLKSIFAYDPETFLAMIFRRIRKVYSTKANVQQLQGVIKEYNLLRQKANFKLCPGVSKVLTELNKKNIKQAVISNNSLKDVKKILKQSGIAEQFGLIIGNDSKSLAKKPAPDTYIFAIKKLGLSPKQCVVIEESEIGVKAGKAAGCYTIGVGTGGSSKYQLSKMRPRADKVSVSLVSN